MPQIVKKNTFLVISNCFVKIASATDYHYLHTIFAKKPPQLY